jgi:hypothetical protein
MGGDSATGDGVDPSGWEEKAQFQREARWWRRRRCRSGVAETASMSMVAIRWGGGGVDGSGVAETVSMSMAI